MNPETINKLQEVFKPVAEKIGQGAQFGYEVVLRQQYIIGVQLVIGAVLGLIALSVGLWALKKFYEKELDEYDEDMYGMRAFFGIFLGGLVFVVCLFDSIGYLLNPHFYAIQFFMNLVK